MIRLRGKSSSGGRGGSWGAYAWDKNTSAGLCAKNTGEGGYAQWGVYLWNTTVILKIKDEKAVYNNLVNKHFNIQIDLERLVR